MVNEQFEPDPQDDQVLQVLKEEPGHRAPPRWIHEKTGLKRQYINGSLNDLISAGWVTRLTRGYYELVEDPRDCDSSSSSSSSDAESDSERSGQTA